MSPQELTGRPATLLEARVARVRAAIGDSFLSPYDTALLSAAASCSAGSCRLECKDGCQSGCQDSCKNSQK